MNNRRSDGMLRTLPLPALFLAVTGLWVVVQLVFRIGSIDLITIVTTVIGGLFFGAVVTTLIAVNRRRLGGRRQATAFTSALRTCTSPPDADTTRWREELDRLDHTRLRTVLLAIGCSVLPIGLGIWGLFNPKAQLIAAALVALFLGLDAAVLLALPGQRRRAARLRDNLPSTTNSGDDQ